MLKSSLIELLSSFSSKEIKEFGEYIRSPFHNKNETLIKLYDIVKPLLKAGNPQKLEKEYVFKKLFKGEKYNDGLMRTLMLNLSRLAEDYLVHVNVKDELNYTKMLVNEVNKRNLRKNFNKNIKRLEELVEENKRGLHGYFYDKYVVAGEKDVFNSRERRFLNIKDMPDESLLGQSDSVSLFFLVVFMERSTYLLNRDFITEEDVNLKLLDDMITRIGKRYPEYIPILRLKYNILSLIIHNREEDFFKLKDFIVKNAPVLDRDELFNCAILMQNFCNIMYHKGHVDFPKEVLEIEKILIKENNVVPPASVYHAPVRFRNTVVIALKYKEYEWAKNYMEEFKDRLSPEHRENAYNYCYARLEFEKGLFHNALEKLSLVQNEDINYKIEIKVFLLKIYYELDMEEQAIDLGNTFRQFLANNKLLTELHVESSSNFIRLVNRLFKIKRSDDYGEKAVLLKELKDTSPLIGKEWLIKKAEESIETEKGG